MASKEGHTLTNVSRAQVEALTRKTAVLTENWQRARKARLKEQLAMNAELKRRWLSFDHSETQQVRVAISEATASRRFSQRRNSLKALITAAEIPVNNALAYFVSALGLQRLASSQVPKALAKRL